ncbi:polysaccharide pyruvyl transferase family protein [Nodosilinea sp. LEGE 06152]|uniref:polysaccharide pyruvyl transferase family protein n=1 Tax=Nodosilinea sp. LEGE 06152 TaxID=2777966 RepID=UPI0018818728|nr:polysaccharide pyruvyl transferase family protein [Nodosilinea sp. LEGE 06152]MBE9155757.1 polysaccharide pyruvyl transferase family protein [Nodosilinea sp. LEGE 06152]
MNKEILNSLQEVLALYANKKVFFEKLEGNNGDALITMGSLIAIKTANMKVVENAAEADLIAINGGAGMTDIWSHGLGKLKMYNSDYPSTPLIIFPSSFFFKSTNFADLFADRKSPAYIFSRERYSLEILQGINFSTEVRLGIDHDMAFFLSNSNYLKGLHRKSKGKHILIVERNDPETTTRINRPQKPGLVTAIKKKIPWSVKRPINNSLVWPLRRLLNYSKIVSMDLHRPFVQEQINLISEKYPNTRGLPVVAADISDPALCDFDRFNNLIVNSEVVVSTRLHVGILAAMLGKTTYLKTGNYHKIKGIYEYSLAEKDNVYLIEDASIGQ